MANVLGRSFQLSTNIQKYKHVSIGDIKLLLQPRSRALIRHVHLRVQCPKHLEEKIGRRMLALHN